MMWSFLGGLAGGLFKALFGWFTERQRRADNIELGQKRQETAQREAAAKVTEAMHKAAAEPRDADSTQGRLKDGSF